MERVKRIEYEKTNVTKKTLKLSFNQRYLKEKENKKWIKKKIKSAIKKTIRYMNGNYYSKFEEKMIVGYLVGALKELED